MPTVNISFAIVEIKKCANLQQIRSERDIQAYVRTCRKFYFSAIAPHSIKIHDLSDLKGVYTIIDVEEEKGTFCTV